MEGTDVTLSTLGFEVDATDIVKLVLQFLHEQGLSSAAGELQREVRVVWVCVCVCVSVCECV